MPDSPILHADNAVLASEVRQLIDAAKRRAAVAVNVEISLLYWTVGHRIRQEILQGERAEYGKQVIDGLARLLTENYGKGWGTRQLRYCVRFVEIFPDFEILHTLCSKLSWSHLRQLIYIDDSLKRLIAIELKLGNFRHEYKSQMELYLRWLAKYEQEPNELPPLGIILCAGKKQEQVELLELDKSGIHVAEYLTALPPKEVLTTKLHESISIARQRMIAGDEKNESRST